MLAAADKSPDDIVDIIRGNFTYGDVIPHEWLRPRLGLPKNIVLVSHQLYYSNYVEKIRNIMLHTYKMDLVSEFGQGYLIISPEHQAELAHEQGVKAAIRELNKAKNRARNVNVEMLTDEQRRKATDTAVHLRSYARMLKARARKRDNWK